MFLPTATVNYTRGVRDVKARQLPLPLVPKSGYGLLASALDACESLPSVQAMLRDIELSRRNTRPGYSPSAMFRAFCVKYLLGERFNVGLIERLRQSPRLREICGLDSDIPSESTFSRFFSRMASTPDPCELFTVEMVEKLREELPGLGQGVAVDSTDIEAYANPNRSDVKDPDAAWGAEPPRSRLGRRPGRKRSLSSAISYMRSTMRSTESRWSTQYYLPTEMTLQNCPHLSGRPTRGSAG